MNLFRKGLTAGAMVLACAAGRGQTINLSGTWEFSRTDGGRTQHIALPGSTATGGIGDEVDTKTPWTGQIVSQAYFTDPAYAPYRQPGNIKIPFWLQPVKFYKGEAWYRRTVDIPRGWADKAIELYLERCHWQTELYIDGRKAGAENSLGTPHRFDLTGVLTPGRHELALCVDNRIKEVDPGINSHSLSDHTQTNWNGITGRMELTARPLVHMVRTEVYPDTDHTKIRLKGFVRNAGSGSRTAEVTFAAGGRSLKKTVQVAAHSVQTVEADLQLAPGIALWDEFSPRLHELKATVADPGAGTRHSRTEHFGMRSFRTEDGRLCINGRPVLLRGTLDCAAYPLTGYAPMDLKAWKKVFRACKAHGINHVRYHSWCPPEAAFEAADELGLYLEVECSSWANTSTTIGDGKPIDAYVLRESERMAEAYGNHPSFCMLMYGNEPGGGRQTAYLRNFVEHWKAKDNRRLYSTAGGWPLIAENDFMCSITPRIQGWGQGLHSIINAQAPRTDYDWRDFTKAYTQPVVSHEVGQWCAYPNFREMKKYTGVLKPRNFEIFRATLREAGMLHLADSFLMASGRLQTLCYKADVEAALRTKDFGGFQLLGLSDFPGQGTALVGILDAFWEEKGYVSPEEFRSFCSETVPLVRLPRLVYLNSERLTGTAEVAHYGSKPLRQVPAAWAIKDAKGRTLKKGGWGTKDIDVGNGQSLGGIDVALDEFTRPVQLTLEVSVGRHRNSWNFWVYPDNRDVRTADAGGIVLTDTLDQRTLKALDEGRDVLLSLRKGTLSAACGGNIAIGFSSIFWNTAWTVGQPPHTLGLLCNPKSPVLELFPTSWHSDYQWWDAMSHSSAIVYRNVAPGASPLLRVIDDWFTNRPLTLLFEVKVGRGRLLVSGIDFWNDMENRPAGRQLLRSILHYMKSPSFHPRTTGDIRQLQQLFAAGR